MSFRLTRRDALRGFAGFGAVALLAACGGGQAATNGAAAPTAAPAAAPTAASGTAPVAQATTAAAAPTAAGKANAGQVTISVAHWQTGLSAQLFNKIYDAFQQANPDVAIKQEAAPFDQHFQRIEVGVAGGSAPDCFHSSGAYFLNFVKKGICLELTSYVTRDKVDYSGIWTEDDEMKYQGKWYSTPMWNTDDLLYYNKTQFDKQGVSVPTDDWTWNDMLAAAQKLTTKTADGKVDVWGVQIPNGVQGGWGAMIYSNAGDWMNADRTKTTMDQPPALEAMQFIDDLMRKHKVMPTKTDNQALTQAGVTDPFVAGKVAMYTAITSNVPNYIKNAKFEWDVALIPKGPRSGKNGSTYIVQPANITKSTKYPEQCWKLLTYITSQDSQKILATDKTKFVINIAAAKDTKSGYSAPPPANIARAVATMDFAKDLRFITAWAEYQQKIDDQLDKAYLGQSTMADAVKAAVDAGDKVLAQS